MRQKYVIHKNSNKRLLHLKERFTGPGVGLATAASSLVLLYAALVVMEHHVRTAGALAAGSNFISATPTVIILVISVATVRHAKRTAWHVGRWIGTGALILGGLGVVLTFMDVPTAAISLGVWWLGVLQLFWQLKASKEHALSRKEAKAAKTMEQDPHFWVSLQEMLDEETRSDVPAGRE